MAKRSYNQDSNNQNLNPQPTLPQKRRKIDPSRSTSISSTSTTTSSKPTWFSSIKNMFFPPSSTSTSTTKPTQSTSKLHQTGGGGAKAAFPRPIVPNPFQPTSSRPPPVEEDSQQSPYEIAYNEWKWESSRRKAQGLDALPPPSKSDYKKKRSPEAQYKKKRPLLLKKKKSQNEKLEERLEKIEVVKEEEWTGIQDQGLESYREIVRIGNAKEAFEPSTRVSGKSKKDATGGTLSITSGIDRTLQNAKRSSQTRTLLPNSFAYEKLMASLEEEDKSIDERLMGGRIKKRKFPPTVTSAEAQLIHTIQTTGPLTSIVSSMIGAEVTRKDILTLRGSTWLNDEPITFYAMLINQRSKNAEKDKGQVKGENGVGYKARKAYCFNSFFYKKFTDKEKDNGGYKSVKRWTKRVDLFTQDIVIIPINQGNSHWVCAAINFSQKRFEYFDSLGSQNLKVYKVLREYLRLEWDDKMRVKSGGRELDLDEWVDYWDEDVPKQENGCDCGIFTCQFMESKSRSDDPFDFTQAQMPYFRNKMVLEMKNLRLVVEPFK